MAPSQLALASQCTSASQAASASRFASANRFILTRQFALATRSRRPAIFIARNVITFNARRCASVATFPSRSTLGAILLFTMSDITPRFPSHRPGLRSGIVCSTDEPRGIDVIVATRRPRHDDNRTLMIPAGGARRDRTDDLLLAKQALSQLSYGPGPERTHPTDRNPGRGRAWWAWEDLNFRPHAYQARALTN
jgi:hypothetical protein